MTRFLPPKAFSEPKGFTQKQGLEGTAQVRGPAHGLLPSLLALITVLLLAPLASAAVPAYDFCGNVTIGTNTSTDGATVSAWVNNAPVAVAFVGGRGTQPGVPSGTYLMHIPGTIAAGTNATFKVWDIAVASAILNETPSRELYLATPDR